MVRRLEELGLARPGTWDWFRSHGGHDQPAGGAGPGRLPSPSRGPRVAPPATSRDGSTRAAADIVDAVPNRVLVTSNVRHELWEGRGRGHGSWGGSKR